MRTKERFLLVLPAILSVFLLAACGTPPARQVERVETPAETSKPVAKSASKGNVTLKRGGGFYKDDGPAEDTPDNLDAIPDAEPKAEPLHRFANRPYVVLGKSYVPNTTLKPHQQRGIASWYGKKFHGQKTSIGEPYDMFSMTAAHPTLAIPSYVRVTSANNGKSVVVRVTDRGPFHADRVIDLSYAAAYKLGFINNGSGPVELEAILPGDATGLTYAQVKPPERLAAKPSVPRSEGDEIEAIAQKLAAEELPQAVAVAPLPVPAIAPALLTRGLFLQLGAFASADNAESLRAHLSRELEWLNEAIQINAGGGIHRVHLGPYASRAEAEKVAEKIRLALGYKPTFVTR
jgi:rare lipoprotein A